MYADVTFLLMLMLKVLMMLLLLLLMPTLLMVLLLLMILIICTVHDADIAVGCVYEAEVIYVVFVYDIPAAAVVAATVRFYLIIFLILLNFSAHHFT